MILFPSLSFRMDYIETTWLRRLDEPKHAGHVPCGVLYKVIRNMFPKAKTNPRIYPSLISWSTARCRWGCVEWQSIMEQQRKRKAEEAITYPTKKIKPTPPKHGQQLFFEANSYWFDQYGPKKGDQVKLLLDCSYTVPILNRDFVQRHHIHWVKRDHPITVQTADGKPMEGSGDKYSEEVILQIGTH